MKLFVTGASGFIGGSVAATAASRGHQVRGLVRSVEKANLCRKFGITPVYGTLADHDLLFEEAQTADAVINAASSDNREVVNTLLNALTDSGKALLHTSGSSVVADDAEGEPGDAIFDEEHMPSPTVGKAARAELDHAILSASGIRSVILCNSLIFGNALGPSADSVQLPLLIKHARESGKVPYVGRGLNRWATVHIADVADLYLLALEKAPSGTFAFVESGEAAFRDMANSMADALAMKAVSMSIEEAEALWGHSRARYSLASNSRVRSLYTRNWGWSPKHPSVYQWIAKHLSSNGWA